MSQQEINIHVNELRNEDISKYPSFFQMARNAVKQIWVSGSGVLDGQPFLAKPEIANARLEICNACEYFEKESGRCRKCGCFMTAKANLLKSGCPINKWVGLTDAILVDNSQKLSAQNTQNKITVPIDIPPISEKFSSAPSTFNPDHHLAKKSSFIKLGNTYTQQEQDEFDKLYEAASVAEKEEDRTFKFKGFTYTVKRDLVAEKMKKYNNLGFNPNKIE